MEVSPCGVPLVLVMAQNLRLKWAEFHENISSAFRNFRGENDLTDVTLACEDGQQIEAHKVILAASSPTFRNLFGRNKHPHPLIFMTRVKSSDLSSILDFLYFGEANVPQIDLESFLAIADQLKLDGLTGPTSDYGQEQTVRQSFPKRNIELEENGIQSGWNGRNSSPIKQTSTAALKDLGDAIKKDPRIVGKEYVPPSELLDDSIKDRVVMQKNFYGALNLEVQSMMEMTQNTIKNGQAKRHSYQCKVCGKEGHGSNIKKHIEANHLEGLLVPCNLCEKRFRSRNGLGQHKVVYHQ